MIHSQAIVNKRPGILLMAENTAIHD